MSTSSYAQKGTFAFPWSAITAPLADNAILHGPLFTRPLVGAQPIEEFYEANRLVAGPLRLRWSLSQANEHLLVGDQSIGEREISSGFWLRRDSSGVVTEISHGMSPFPRLPPFHDAMRWRLGGLVPDAHWEIDEAARVRDVVGEEVFPPFRLEEDARFLSPLVDKPLQGVDRVRKALAEATVVYGTRRYLVRFPGREAFGSVWEAAVDGHVVRCMSLFVLSSAGAIKDIIACMLPYPVLALVYHGVKERNKEALGATYFSV
jgi:hypothetical protein